MNAKTLSAVMRELGKKGGKVTAAKMTPTERIERARKAGKAGAKARWADRTK